jgi:trehalose/maltose hydrolase-like predicted phosphorylase
MTYAVYHFIVTLTHKIGKGINHDNGYIGKRINHDCGYIRKGINHDNGYIGKRINHDSKHDKSFFCKSS